jgi:hypothetical protein
MSEIRKKQMLEESNDERGVAAKLTDLPDDALRAPKVPDTIGAPPKVSSSDQPAADPPKSPKVIVSIRGIPAATPQKSAEAPPTKAADPVAPKDVPSTEKAKGSAPKAADVVGDAPKRDGKAATGDVVCDDALVDAAKQTGEPTAAAITEAPKDVPAKPKKAEATPADVDSEEEDDDYDPKKVDDGEAARSGSDSSSSSSEDEEKVGEILPPAEKRSKDAKKFYVDDEAEVADGAAGDDEEDADESGNLKGFVVDDGEDDDAPETVHVIPPEDKEEEEEGGDTIVDKSWLVEGSDPEEEDADHPLVMEAFFRDIAKKGFTKEQAGLMVKYFVNPRMKREVCETMAEMKEGASKKREAGSSCPISLDDFMDVAVAVGVSEFFHRTYKSDGESRFNEYVKEDRAFSAVLGKMFNCRRAIQDAIDRLKRLPRPPKSSTPAAAASSSQRTEFVYFNDASNDGSSDAQAPAAKEGYAAELINQATLCYGIKVFSLSDGILDRKPADHLDGIWIASSREGVRLRAVDACIVEMNFYQEETKRAWVKCYIVPLVVARLAVLVHRFKRIDDPMIAKHFRKPPKPIPDVAPMKLISDYIADNRKSFVDMWEDWKRVGETVSSDVRRAAMTNRASQ